MGLTLVGGNDVLRAFGARVAVGARVALQKNDADVDRGEFPFSPPSATEARPSCASASAEKVLHAFTLFGEFFQGNPDALA